MPFLEYVVRAVASIVTHSGIGVVPLAQGQAKGPPQFIPKISDVGSQE